MVKRSKFKQIDLVDNVGIEAVRETISFLPPECKWSIAEIRPESDLSGNKKIEDLANSVNRTNRAIW